MKKSRRFRKRYVVFILLGIGAAWFGYALVSALSAQPNLATDYGELLHERSQALQPASIDGDPLLNGWPVLLDALDRLEEIEAQVLEQTTPESIEERDYLDYDRVRIGPFKPDESPNEIAVIVQAEDAGVYDLLDEAARAPFVLRPAISDTPLFNVSLPNLGRFRYMAKCRAAAMRKAAVEEDWDEFVRAAEHIFMLGEVTSKQCMPIDYLVGVAIGGLGCRELREILHEHRVPPETCARLIEIVEERAPASIAHALECERLSMYDVIQSFYTDRGSGNGQLILSKFDSAFLFPGAGSNLPDVGRFKNLAAPFFADRRETKQEADFLFDTAIRHSGLDGITRQADPVQIEQYIASLGYRHIFVQTFASVIDRMPRQQDRTGQEYDSTRIMLALEMYATWNGSEFPYSLDALVPGILDELPVDPLNGLPYGYRLIENDEVDSWNREYLLYSLGHDAEDNQGREVVKGENRSRRSALRFDDPQGIGYDYVFNTVRDSW